MGWFLNYTFHPVLFKDSSASQRRSFVRSKGTECLLAVFLISICRLVGSVAMVNCGGGALQYPTQVDNNCLHMLL